MEKGHCVRRDGDEIRNFLQRIKRTVDKGWLDDMSGGAGAQQVKLLSEKLKADREDYGIWITVYEDLDQNIYSGKPKSN